jgi:MFS family permease
MTGISLTVAALLLASQLHAGASYLQIFVILVLMGLGSGTALVPLTTAGLAGVEPGDAGAASGLVNVTQQVGAALGLAVLVTVLSAASGHAQLKAGAGVPTSLVHGLDMTFGLAGLFGIAALVLVALLVRLPAADQDAPALAVAAEAAAEEFELVDGEGFEWPGPELVA